MARVFIDDRWLRVAEDGTYPSASAKRSLASARDPMQSRVDTKWRSSRFGVGKRWRCRWYLRKNDGSKVQKSKAFSSLADAEAYKAGMEDDVRRGRYSDPSQENRIFADVAELWLQSKLDIKPGTLGRYQREIRVYINPKWGSTPLRGFTRQDLQEWVKNLAEGDYPAELPDGRESIPLSPRSIRNIVRVVLGGVLGFAVKNGWMSDNPISSISTPKIVKNDDMVFLDIGEIELLAEEVRTVGEDIDALLVRFLGYVGPRVSEATALQVGDLDLSGRRARIKRTWATNEVGKEILGVPKSGKARWVAIPEFLIDELADAVNGLPDNAYVFRSKRGGHINVRNWRTRIWYPSLRLAGMEDEGITIHSLRHTYASIAIAAGADVKTLQQQLGHASAVITLDTYAALWPERLSDVADAVNARRSAVIVSNRVRENEKPETLVA